MQYLYASQHTTFGNIQTGQEVTTHSIPLSARLHSLNHRIQYE